MTTADKKKAPASLTQFVKRKKRDGCPVCALDVAVRGQLAEARSRKIGRTLQLEWLKQEVGARITDADLTSHVNGKHDVE